MYYLTNIVLTEYRCINENNSLISQQQSIRKEFACAPAPHTLALENKKNKNNYKKQFSSLLSPPPQNIITPCGHIKFDHREFFTYKNEAYSNQLRSQKW